MRKSGFDGLTHFLFFFEKEGHHHGYSMPVSDILTFLISAFIIAKTYNELNTEGVNRV